MESIFNADNFEIRFITYAFFGAVLSFFYNLCTVIFDVDSHHLYLSLPDKREIVEALKSMNVSEAVLSLEFYENIIASKAWYYNLRPLAVTNYERIPRHSRVMLLSVLFFAAFTRNIFSIAGVASGFFVCKLIMHFFGYPKKHIEEKYESTFKLYTLSVKDQLSRVDIISRQLDVRSKVLSSIIEETYSCYALFFLALGFFVAFRIISKF